jgi:hypothetical protein
MSIRKFQDFIKESKRYFHGGFLNFGDATDFIEKKYELQKELLEKYPEMRDPLKTIRYYLEFEYKNKKERIKIQFGPWVKVSANNVAEWRGYLNTEDTRVVLSTRFFDDRRFDRNEKTAILFHEVVHAVDPKSLPVSGKKDGTINLEIAQRAKKIGLKMGPKSDAQSSLFKIIEYLNSGGSEPDEWYHSSPTEYDAWISELVFGIELYLISIDDDEKEAVIETILERLRAGDYSWAGQFAGGVNYQYYFEGFAKMDKKFTRRMFSSIYSAISGINELKRTPFKMSAKLDIGPRKILKETLTEKEFSEILGELESK